MNEKIVGSRKVVLGLQHVVAMFGATVLVPLLTGLNSSIALFCAGVGTLIFHSVTKGIVPVFLGSSFAFIGAISLVLQQQGLGAVKGGLIVAGMVYMIFSLGIKIIGYEKVNKLLPPIVTGPMIIVIGLRLSGTAISSAFYVDGNINGKSVIVSLIVILIMIFVSVFTKGFLNLLPVMVALIVGYIVCIPMGLVDFSGIASASWLSFMDNNVMDQVLTLPEFNLTAIAAIAPVALVTVIEHVGDITTNGAVVGKNFMKEPGVHRTLLGDGLATAVAGFLGGPANTTYGENTGVLAVTKVYDPSVIRVAALFAMLLGVIGKFGAFISSIPEAVRGGISIILFGMIASVGVRIIINARLNFGNSRNLMISSLIFVLGIGIGTDIPITESVSISGLAIAAFVGIVLAAVLPEKEDGVLND
ncbi:uracil-xanthine permease family protein [Lachnospiraceae bacterium LCP25S3_G4]